MSKANDIALGLDERNEGENLVFSFGYYKSGSACIEEPHQFARY